MNRTTLLPFTTRPARILAGLVLPVLLKYGMHNPAYLFTDLPGIIPYLILAFFLNFIPIVSMVVVVELLVTVAEGRFKWFGPVAGAIIGLVTTKGVEKTVLPYYYPHVENAQIGFLAATILIGMFIVHRELRTVQEGDTIERPLGVTLLALLSLFVGGSALFEVMSSAVLWIDNSPTRYVKAVDMIPSMARNLILVATGLSTTVGLWRGRVWGWRCGIGFAVLIILFRLSFLFQIPWSDPTSIYYLIGKILIPVVLSVLTIVYLKRKPVRILFTTDKE